MKGACIELKASGAYRAFAGTVIDTPRGCSAGRRQRSGSCRAVRGVLSLAAAQCHVNNRSKVPCLSLFLAGKLASVLMWQMQMLCLCCNI